MDYGVLTGRYCGCLINSGIKQALKKSFPMRIFAPFVRWFIAGYVFTVAPICQVSRPAIAQVIPDSSLGQNISVVTSESSTDDRFSSSVQISGGLVRDTNLFHSFQNFDIEPEQAVFFQNPTGVDTIFSRVTGNTPSRIFGTLGVLGEADLFFLNPNGIVFGPGTALDLDGSFIASTASQIDFEDGGLFSANPASEVPLLTVSAPTGLSFDQPGAISVEGALASIKSLANPNSLPTRLVVPARRSLILVGGDVRLNQAILTADSGRIEVGSVTEGQIGLSEVPLSPSEEQQESKQPFEQPVTAWFVDYAEASALEDISLSNHSVLNASGSGGGSIQVQGENVSITEGSVLFIQHQAEQPTDSITISATDSLILSTAVTPFQSPNSGGNPFGSSIINLTEGSTSSQPITIDTNRLQIENANISSFVLEEATGTGSDINITATESVEISGVFESPGNPPLATGIGAVSNGVGRNGDITLITDRLSLIGGGAIGTQINGNAEAGGGNIFVDAAESVQLTGSSPTATLVSTIAAITATSTDAGNLILNTQQLIVSEGAGITSVTGGSGSTGELNINASDSITITGVALARSEDKVVPISSTPSFISAAVPILPAASGEALNFSPQPSGNSGRLNVTTPKLTIQAGGILGVDNQGTGDAGDLIVNATSIILGNNTLDKPQAGITAATASGEGGNIRLLISEWLLLQPNGVISAEAGGTGNGGNIAIEAGFIVAPPNADSDIIANAFEGEGGSIDITAQSILGLSAGPAASDNGTNDIDASSQFGTSGTVTLNEINAEPTQEARHFEEAFAMAEISQRCNPGEEISSFIATGRGGIPLGPEETMTAQDFWEELYVPNPENDSPENDDIDNEYSDRPLPSSSRMTLTSAAPALVEAQGWRLGADGVVQLFAQATTPNLSQIQHERHTCAPTN